MKDPLVRFGVAMEKSLLTDFDHIVEGRGSTRSEAFRDLARAEVSKAKTSTDAESVASLTLVYDHHVRDLTDKLTEMQHELGERVRSTMHVHLDSDHCLEVIVLRGRAGELRAAADRILGTRGVSHGGIENRRARPKRCNGSHAFALACARPRPHAFA